MRRFLQLGVLVLVCTATVGCDLIINIPPDETGSPKLKQFGSEQELTTYYRDQIRARNGSLPRLETAFNESAMGDDADGGATSGNAPPQAAMDGAAGEGEDHSNTTTQEVGVDEADVVKTDGDFIYMIDSRFDGNSVLRIVRASPADELEVVSESELEGYGQDLYLRGDQVVAITSGGGLFMYFGGGGGIAEGGAVEGDVVLSQAGDGTDGAEPDVKPDAEPVDADVISTPAPDIGFVEGDYEYRRPYTVVTIIDVADRGDPAVSSTTSFDGTPSSSRMIDGVLHLVLANYQEYYYDVMPMLGRPELSASSVDVPELLPDFEKVSADGTVSGGDLVTWENLYRPTDPDGFGLVTVVSMNTDDPDAAFSSVGIVAEPGLIYSSTSALYLTDTNNNFSNDQRTTTDIYKLAYDGASATPVASGSIPGRILNQYSMGEHEGNLRVASTIDPVFFFDADGTFNPDEPVNAVYVLSPTEDNLTITGRAENIAPGETIQSARFTGNRGYLVTFRQIDPLFTMDLSDPTQPEIVGELHVPGFSTFLVPMDQDHLLAVGQYVPPPGESGAWGVQLSIFDVSDFANPTRSSNIVVGGDIGSYSEALWNPKAFTYFAEQDLVALPISVYGGFFVDDVVGIGFDSGDVPVDGDTGVSDGGGSSSDGSEPDAPPSDADDDVAIDEPGDPFVHGFEGLVVFRATAADGLVELGRISTQFDDAEFWYPSFTRGVFIGDHVFAVTNIGVRAAATDDLETVEGELFYGPVFDDLPVEPTDPGVIVDPIPVEPDGGIGGEPTDPEGNSGG